MKRLLPLLGLLVVLALAGCGGGHHSATTAKAGPTPTTATSTTSNAPTFPYDCDPTADTYSMLCPGVTPSTGALNGSPAGKVGVSQSEAFGIDTYNGGNPASGAFDCSYVPLAGKGWSLGQLEQWHNDGKPTCAVFESDATRAEDGYSAGQSDARYALAWANSVGMPAYVPIFFAVDTDASAASVASYFSGVHSILGGRTGAYGSYFVIAGLENDHLITPSTAWQTLAWSQGNVGNACLYQRAIPEMGGTFINGAWVDLDTARCANWGQWPYVAPKPPNPEHYERFDAHRRTFHVNQVGNPCQADFGTCLTVHARERSAVRTFDKAGCVLSKKSHAFIRRTCRVHAQHMRLLRGRLISLHRHHHRWSYGKPTSIGDRNQELFHRLHATRPVRSWDAGL